MAKQDNLNHRHLEWLVASRSDNQKCALELLKLFDKFSIEFHGKELLQIAHGLVAICFSLWRAAFLADKTGQRDLVFADARAFLGKMLVDNAINYPQDRNAREWTFNYYMTNAKNGLMTLSERWSEIERDLGDRTKTVRGNTNAERRWARYQRALTTALGCVSREFEAAARTSSRNKPSKGKKGRR